MIRECSVELLGFDQVERNRREWAKARRWERDFCVSSISTRMTCCRMRGIWQGVVEDKNRKVGSASYPGTLKERENFNLKLQEIGNYCKFLKWHTKAVFPQYQSKSVQINLNLNLPEILEMSETSRERTSQEAAPLN